MMIPISPFANDPQADACRFGNGLRHVPALDIRTVALDHVVLDGHPYACS
jgi:hypothetical protein